MSDVIQEKQNGGGTAKPYPIPPDVAFDIARDVLRTQGADAIEEHRAEGFLLTSSSANAATMGTYMGVWCTALGEQTVVTVVTKRKLAMNMMTTLTESGFHEYFARAMAARAAKSQPDAGGQAGSKCATTSDCTGALPKDCITCPAGQRGGCLHWVCLSGQCLTRNCDPHEAQLFSRDGDGGDGD